MGRYLYSSVGLGIRYNGNPCKGPAFQGEITISTTQIAELHPFDFFLYDSAFDANCLGSWVVQGAGCLDSLEKCCIETSTMNSLVVYPNAFNHRNA